jgi:hypothetical protein
MSNILLVELNTYEILIDKSLFPDKQENSFIYEHLKYYLSKSNTLPTISVKVYGAEVLLIGRFEYLLIARDLGYQRIRAIIDTYSSEDDLQVFLRKPSVVKLDWKSALMEGSDTLAEYVWLVFFFQKQLKQEECQIFENQVVNFFEQIKLPLQDEPPYGRIRNLNYSYSGKCAEFQAYIPVEDERWYKHSLTIIGEFHLNCVPIASFQGRKFR